MSGSSLHQKSILKPVEFGEYAWSDRSNPSSDFNFSRGTRVTGGGVSIIFPAPDYQIAANIMKFESNIRDMAGGHFIPDIAGMVGL
jgi:subtilase family serine protease